MISGISQRLSLQHTPEVLHPFPISPGQMKTAVSAPAVENETPREHFSSLESHLRRSHGYTHILQHQSPRRESQTHTSRQMGEDPATDMYIEQNV